MSDVTKFSGTFAAMAVEYAKMTKRRRIQSSPTVSETPHESDELAIRVAMERAIRRRLKLAEPKS